MSPRPLVAVSAPRALSKGAVLTKASPVLQWEPAAIAGGETTDAQSVARLARPTSALASPPIPVIERIVLHTQLDVRELAPRASQAPARRRYGAIVVAAFLAAAIGALAGVSMRAVTPAAPAAAAAVHTR